MNTATLDEKKVEAQAAVRKDDHGKPSQPTVRWLGWVNIGLGLTEAIAPRKMSRWWGMPGRPGLTRVMGIRKVAAGVGMLSHPQSARMFWARAGGDALELAGILRTSGGEHGRKRAALIAAGVAAMDVMCARALGKAPADGDGWRRFSTSAAINLPPSVCYQYWRDLEKFPTFFTNLKSVRVTGDKSHWVAKGPAGKDIEWDSEITEDVPNERISWRSTGEPAMPNSGSVRFESVRNGASTIVRLHVSFELPVSRRSKLVSALGRDPGLRLRRDLIRFKQIVETGEVATTEGQPSGRPEGATWLDRAANLD